MKKGRKYQGYTKDATFEQVGVAFTRKFGYPPDEVFIEYGYVFAGPIDESQLPVWKDAK